MKVNVERSRDSMQEMANKSEHISNWSWEKEIKNRSPNVAILTKQWKIDNYHRISADRYREKVLMVTEKEKKSDHKKKSCGKHRTNNVLSHMYFHFLCTQPANCMKPLSTEHSDKKFVDLSRTKNKDIDEVKQKTKTSDLDT